MRRAHAAHNVNFLPAEQLISPPCCAQEDAADAGVGGDEEVRFSLPGMPSPAAVLCLLAAVGELHRAGGPAVGMQALQLLAWHLSHACLGALRCAPALLAAQHLEQPVTSSASCWSLPPIDSFEDAG